MNLHVTLTPTELKAHQRHRDFHDQIARRASQLQSDKLLAALRVQRQTREIAPEAFPAEPDPPPAPAPIIPAVIRNRIALIQRLVCKSFHIEIAELCSARRSAAVAVPRQLAMYLCKKLTSQSFVFIGKKMGGRDHTTVLYSCARMEEIISKPFGTGISLQWPGKLCDLVREKEAQIRWDFVQTVAEMEEEALETAHL